MLYFYQSISPHSIENLHKYLHYFFTQLFANAHPSYDHAHYIEADFNDIIDEYTVQIDNKLEAIFTAYAGLQPNEKLIVQNAYSINNNIQGICNMVVTPVKYAGLPTAIRVQIKSLYDNLWGDNKILGYTQVVNRCGTLKTHFNNFRVVNEYSVCPFCGIDCLLCEHDDGRDDYDHYLPKSNYPFITVNFQNLFPMCHNCNSKSKGQIDTPFIQDTTTQRPLYYPLDNTIVDHKISLGITSANTDLGNPVTWTLSIDCEPVANNLKMESWKQVFNIESRYKATISKESKIWKGWILKKHTTLCKKNGASYQAFHDDAAETFEDCFNIDKGILMKTFYDFILNDPNCENNLNGII